MNVSSKIQWFDPFGGHPMASYICDKINQHPGFKVGRFILREFPDGETYVQIKSAVSPRVIIFADLSNPDSKLLKLILFAETIRDLGAEEITLVAPYLPYMRQDIRFKAGEGITSRYFARLLSGSFNKLVTIDPHLHRFQKLGEIYSLKAKTLSAAGHIAEWVKNEINNPVMIGPDSESDQWVSRVAHLAGCKYQVFSKTRFGDKEVAIDAGDLELFEDYTPVILDDIVSTGRTIINTAREMKEAGLNDPVCIAVHPLFAGDAWDEIAKNGIARVVTCNTIAHPSNGINLGDLVFNELSRPGG